MELNIIERGLRGQDWTPEGGPITSGDLDRIVEQSTQNSGALNALPTPFARFFVVREAFRRVLEETRDPQKQAGTAYRRLVSDTLDIFELLYNLNYHKGLWSDGRLSIEIREWEMNSELNRLKQATPILEKCVHNYITGDLKLENQVDPKLFFIVLKDLRYGRSYLLGTSSPFTGFVTPPDLDKVDKDGNTSFMGKRYETLPLLQRKGEGAGRYFRDICLFENRSHEFKNYLFHLIDSNTGELGDELRTLRDYVRYFNAFGNHINLLWRPQTEPIISDNASPVVINGLPLGKDVGLGTINFFADKLVELPYRINAEAYQTIQFEQEAPELNKDFLIPIRREALAIINEPFECTCRVRNTDVIVTLTYRGRQYSKTYTKRNDIVSLNNADFNIGVFPNRLSVNDAENNYFKVMALFKDTTTTMLPLEKSLQLDFYRKADNGAYRRIETVGQQDKGALFGVRQAVVRTRPTSTEAGTVLYEVFNTVYDAVTLELHVGGNTCEGLLLPRWQRQQNPQDTFTYAIDLGSTNTYISCRRNGEALRPEQLRMQEPMVAYLHEKRSSDARSLVWQIESPLPQPILNGFRTQFVPPLIDSDFYRFPIRTALCVTTSDHSSASLFDNRNIAFFYERAKGLNNQTVRTDIKWEEDNESDLRMFVRELLLIIKADVLRRNGIIANTKLVRFSPLSFTDAMRANYTAIWQEEASRVLHIDNSAIKCISESEAPYYYFNKGGEFSHTESVALVDIGGGSCDFMYFADGRPQIANSVHFGCDTLWGNGISEFTNARDNGVFKRYANIITFDNKELQELNTSICAEGSSRSTKDIINFWLSNDSETNLSRLLRKDYKPLFLYHFTAVLYYMARMYHVKSLPCPRVVLFCGNGSRYIDNLLSTNAQTIHDLVMHIFAHVYGPTISDIQVILNEERKECTCYGGLYYPDNSDRPQEFDFQGGSANTYKNVGELRDARNVLSGQIIETLQDLGRLYRELLAMLTSKEEANLSEQKIIELHRLVTEKLKDSFERDFDRQLGRLDPNRTFHDSVFFFPVIDNILSLTSFN
jgi:hypothetical protein